MKLLRSFVYAWNGLKICFSSEANFGIHIVLATITISLGFYLSISHTEWVALIVCTAFVIAMEMINTAIEKLCDVVQQEIHPAIKKIKDIAAGAVMIAAMGSFIIGLIIFLPKIIILIQPLQS